MLKIYYRTSQKVLKVVSPLLPWREPELIEGENSILCLPKLLENKGIKNVLVVTDNNIVKLGLMNDLLNGLEQNKINYTIYDKTVPNPTIQNIEDALKMYYKHDCESVIAFGGGSPIDCAKIVAARVVKPKQSISEMKGVLKIRKTIPLFIAVPTTAGTGSECTIAAVITNPETHEKYSINDPVLIPHYAVLDPKLTVGLPKQITATTGMDALTHAVEAYIGKSNTKDTLKWSETAVKLIFNNIYEVYENGSNIEARTSMLKASYYAGLSFTRAYVGNVHAIAHTLGGFYNVPHGLANAIILPIVLEYYGKSVHKSLGDLAKIVNLGDESDTDKVLAEKFINWIKDMNVRMGIPTIIPEIKTNDIPLMVKRAYHESNPFYPVPKIFSKNDFSKIYSLVKGESQVQ
ncbi:iron-containing alcohol dehydrogenase [Mycoplasmatota bacterium]|nr:iron-containing alcohol dehydrogenase [Mycoplasmatota bacterium]